MSPPAKCDTHLRNSTPNYKHGFELSSDALRYSPLWYRGSNAIMDAVRFARSCSRSRRVVIHVYDPAGNLIETLDYQGDFKEP